MPWKFLSALFAETPPAPLRRRMLREYDTPRRRLPEAALPPGAAEIAGKFRGAAGVALCREMELTDPTVAAAIRIRRSAVAGLPRRVVANGAPEAIVQFVADALARIDDLRGDLEELLDAVPVGRAVSEVILEPAGDVGGRPLLWPVRIQSRDPADYVFDDAGNLRLLTGREPVVGEPLPAAPKFVAVAYNPRHEDPHGTPELAALYPAWRMKRDAVRAWAVALDKGGMPFLLARLRQRLPDDETRRLEELLAGFQSESYGWICSDDVEDLRFLEPTRGFARDTYLPFLEYWDRRMLVRYLGSHLAFDMPGAGSRAAAAAHSAVTASIVRDDAAWLGHRFSSAFLAPLVRLNFDYAGPCPRLEMVAE